MKIRTYFFSAFFALLVFNNSIHANVLDTIKVTFPYYTTCQGECVTISPMITKLKEPATFNWETGDTTRSIVGCPEYSRNYIVTITDADGSKLVAYPYINVARKNFNPFPKINTPACFGENVKFIIPNYGINIKYKWSGPNGFTSEQREFSFPNADQSINGKYRLTFIQNDKCVGDTFYYDVFVNDDHLFHSTVDSISRCHTVCNLTSLLLKGGKLPSNISTGSQPEYLDEVKQVKPSNIIWFSFVGQPGDHTLNIDIKNCNNIATEYGARVGIYADAQFKNLIIKSDSCFTGKFTIPSSLLVPGQKYYAYIDGCGGNICSYQITVLGQTFQKYCDDYVPFETATDWKGHTSNFGFSGSFWYSYKKDTTFFGKKYRQIDFIPKGYYSIYLREDKLNRKVYEYRNGSEFLLYDFSLKKGDSFKPPMINNTYTVSSIDTIPSHYGPLKRWNFNHPFFASFSYVECLGGNQLQYYLSLIYSDPVYGISCVYNHCDEITKNGTCEFPIGRVERDTTRINICQGETYQGYTTSGYYTTTAVGENDCPAYATLALTVIPKDTAQVAVILCEGESYNGINNEGSYLFINKNKYGCDSITIADINIQRPSSLALSKTLCDGDSLSFHGKQIFNSGVYIDTIYTNNGCIDSIYTLNAQFIINDTTHIDTIICSGYEAFGYTESGSYIIDSLDLINGCRKIYKIELEVLPSNAEPCLSAVDQIFSAKPFLYPNPNQGQFNIYYKGHFNSIVTFDAYGRMVYDIEYQHKDQYLLFQMKNQTAGLYWLKIVIDGKAHLLSFIKQ